MKIDRQTAGDLELFRSRNGTGGVFHALDRTKTPGGSERLRYRFSHPMPDGDSIRRAQDGVRFLLAERIEFPLNPREVEGVKRYLESSWDVGSRAKGLRLIFDSLVVSIKYRELYRYAARGVAETRHLLTEVREFLDQLASSDPPAEVRGITRDLESLISELGLEGEQPLRGPWAVFRADRLLRVEFRSEMRHFFSLLSELDALIAMAEAVGELGLVFPDVVDSPDFVLEGEGLFHPLLGNPVKNPVRIGGQKPVVFLTGPNMAGKTTYLKTVALSAFLAHTGMGLPAKWLRLLLSPG